LLLHRLLLKIHLIGPDAAAFWKNHGKTDAAPGPGQGETKLGAKPDHIPRSVRTKPNYYLP
jgi:hypothetical protein